MKDIEELKKLARANLEATAANTEQLKSLSTKMEEMMKATLCVSKKLTFLAQGEAAVCGLWP